MSEIKRNNRRVFVSFSASFLLFIIIPILVLNIVAWQAIRITEENERQNCVHLVSDGRELMDSLIRNIQNTVSLIRNNSFFLGLESLQAPLATEDYYHIWLALRSMSGMELNNRGFDMMLYYRNSDLILSPTFMAGSMSDAYGIFFRFGNLDYGRFLSAFAITGNRAVFFPSAEHIWDGVPLRGVIYGIRLGMDISLYFLVHENQITGIFSPVFENNGALYIYDSTGGLLFSHGGGFAPLSMEADLPGEQGILPDGILGPGLIGAYSRSFNGLLYISALETDAALNHVRTLRNLTLILNIAAAALSLGYALFLAARNSRRVEEAFRLLDENPNLPHYDGGNILSYLNLSVSRLVSVNAMLREDVDSRREVLRGAFLDRLLSGDWESREETAAAAEQADIKLESRRFCVVFVLIPNEIQACVNSVDDIREILAGSFERARKDNVEAIIYSRNPSRLGVFFFLDEKRREDFRDYLESFFHNHTAGMEQLNLHLVGSGLRDDILDLVEEYRLCREYALICDNWEKSGIHWIDELPRPARRIFVFPPETEQKLINQLQNADFEGAKESIRVIFSTNLQEGLLTESMLSVLYATLQGCFLRALEGSLADICRDAIEALDFRRPPGELEEDFIALAQKICAAWSDEYSTKNAAIKKEELIAYVETHFGEEQLSLRLAARHFGFSEAYFSQMFKDITGENFSTFTEVTRLNHARTLLRQNLKIEEVAYRCGYKSPSSFRRAYKRCFGINPARSR